MRRTRVQRARRRAGAPGAAAPWAGRPLANALVGLALVAVGCTDDRGPRLDGVVPASASRNTMVTITGRRLCGASGDCMTAAGEIDLGLALPMVRASVVSYADTSAEIVIPPVAPIGSTALVVTVDERSSNALGFEVLP
jgi:hypothetical protein